MLKVIPFLLFFLYQSSIVSTAIDTLTPSASLSVNSTLVSAGERFELGFFTTTATNKSNKKYYLGIWYFKLGLPRTVVWVANRNSPSWSSSVSLRIDGSGRIVLSDVRRSEFVFSSNHSQATSPVLQLLENGNLIVLDQADVSVDGYLWQSFDHPTHTLLPGQKLGWDNKTGLDRYITSWKNNNDPSSGDYSLRLDLRGNPDAFLLKGGVQKIYRTGPWVGTQFGAMPTVNGAPTPTLNITVYDSPGEVYWGYAVKGDQAIEARITVDPSGKLNISFLVDMAPNRKSWSTLFLPNDECDNYAQCGPNGLCNTSNNILLCGCPEGFDHRNPSAWNMFGDGSEGCERRSRLDCPTDTFIVVRSMKTPESAAASVYKDKGLEECKEMCLKDCNCTTYASWDVAHGPPSGCVMWSGDLLDMRTYNVGEQDLYIRVAASPLADDCISTGDNKSDCSNRRSPTKLVLGLSISIASMLAFIIVFGMYQILKRRNEIRMKKDNFKRNGGLLLQQQMLASNSSIERTRLFTSSELEKATDKFNKNRVLGRGGQGTVYKGMLVDGTIVAIKMSKKVSDRQLGQFINEVVILSQVNHRNVVKLLGCCLETDIPLLVYEYVPNGDLFQHIHNPSEDFFITWKMRLQIAVESAEALAYLHSSSHLPIYHRDVKTSNILLDERYRAKVADFGTSKTLSVDQTHVTTAVQGTVGYMDPEFLQSNQYTEKSDVYSFGIVLLELLTSKKPVYLDNFDEPRILASDSLLVMQSSNLFDIVDAKVSEEARNEEIELVADLARRCLNLRGIERPTMKEVAMALGTIRLQNVVLNTTSGQDLITISPICSMDGGLLSTFNSFAPR